MEAGERPWLKPFVHTPTARDPEPGATRRRPLIYVYDLPPMFNALMLQVGVKKSGGWVCGGGARAWHSARSWGTGCFLQRWRILLPDSLPR